VRITCPVCQACIPVPTRAAAQCRPRVRSPAAWRRSRQSSVRRGWARDAIAPGQPRSWRWPSAPACRCRLMTSTACATLTARQRAYTG